ncbi:MAG: 23S rRNA (adenine(2503)-C(2))-methyltransferase RlmN [Bacteroidota bacterium]|nr:23S rRNA (adenine(2503)-C(2))-methyltransferase RlmN [Bacteroidota bacterium]
MAEKLRDIRSFSLDSLRGFFIENKCESYRGDQVYEWIWKKGAKDFRQMTNLSKKTRTLLIDNFTINYIDINCHKKSIDGTIKNTVKLYDGLVIESVLIPTKSRSTACVSSQVGCSLNCQFCATAKIKRLRNLNVDEIFDQVTLMDEQSRLYFKRPLSNIVFMGMGEPLMNYNNLIAAIEKITRFGKFGISSKRITISTSGIPKMIMKLAEEDYKFGLAISLHSARQLVRERIMPFAKKFPISNLLESLKYWYLKTNRIITVEYIVWNNINDKMEDIDELIKFCKKVPSKVNFIQYNSIGDQDYEGVNIEIIKKYQCELSKFGIKSTFRRSRGQDIDAACGQLANKSLSASLSNV